MANLRIIVKRNVFGLLVISAVALLTSACSSMSVPAAKTTSVDEVLDAAKAVAMHGDMKDYAFIEKTLHIELQRGPEEVKKSSDGTSPYRETKYKLLKFSPIYQEDGFSFSNIEPFQYGLAGSTLIIRFSDAMCIKKEDAIKSFSSTPSADPFNSSRVLVDFTIEYRRAIITFNKVDSCAVDLRLSEVWNRQF